MKNSYPNGEEGARRKDKVEKIGPFVFLWAPLRFIFFFLSLLSYPVI
jgi:hypothetical protein